MQGARADEITVVGHVPCVRSGRDWHLWSEGEWRPWDLRTALMLAKAVMPAGRKVAVEDMDRSTEPMFMVAETDYAEDSGAIPEYGCWFNEAETGGVHYSWKTGPGRDDWNIGAVGPPGLARVILATPRYAAENE